MSEIILVQPNTSLTGSFIRMIPLGILYAASYAVKDGCDVQILDARLDPGESINNLDAMITDETLLVGFSVMSGISVLEALRMTEWLKSRHPKIQVVWGGPHPTFSPESVIAHPGIDYVIWGYGAKPFQLLARHLYNSSDAVSLPEIPNLLWRQPNGVVRENRRVHQFEFIDYKDIPYHLIQDYSVYCHIDTSEVVFPLYSVMGCPYKCAFCSSPAMYEKFGNPWKPYPADQVVDHIEFVHKKYGATFIYFIDDDSFVDFNHVTVIVQSIKSRGIDIRLGFRGARINEVLKMSDDFLDMLVGCGTKTMHIGAESGSNRILSLMNKNISVDDTLAVNRIMARHPEISVFYNFVTGYPTETLEETKATRDLILRLIKENPSCFIIPLNKPRPLPGTKLFELARAYGYKHPTTLEEWGHYDVESSDYKPVWLDPDHDKFIRMMFLAMYFVDSKIERLNASKSFYYKVLQFFAKLYKPIAMLRFKKGLPGLLVEDWIYKTVNLFLSSIKK